MESRFKIEEFRQTVNKKKEKSLSSTGFEVDRETHNYFSWPSRNHVVVLNMLKMLLIYSDFANRNI